MVPEATGPLPAALELTFHVTDVSGLLVPSTVAKKFKELPTVTAWSVGPTDMRVIVGIIIETETRLNFDVS